MNRPVSQPPEYWLLQDMNNYSIIGEAFSDVIISEAEYRT